MILEESEFSAFIFRDPRITFLIVPRLLVDTPLHLVHMCERSNVFLFTNSVGL